jgi:hypothetical protein
VTIEAVDTINIVGSNNVVTYRAAIHGDAPAVSKIGNDNLVSVGAPTGAGKAGKDSKGDDKPAPTERTNERTADAAGAQDCAKQPTAIINNGDGSYKFVGACTRITVNGGDNHLAIESVKDLVVNGSGNTVTIGSADKISVPGSENKISVKKGISGPKPKISSLGENNAISQP